MRISYYLNGNLAGKTLSIIIQSLLEVNQHSLNDISLNGYPLDFSSEIYQEFTTNDCEILKERICKSDLFICSPASPGMLEGFLVDYANSQGVLTLVYLSDVDLSTHKIRCLTSLPDYIAVGDRVSYRRLISLGISASRILTIGQPFFEQAFQKWSFISAIYQDVSVKEIMLLEVPNTLDKTIAYPSLPYSERDILNLATTLASGLDVSLYIRPHPKMISKGCPRTPSLRSELHGSLQSKLSNSMLCVSTYSTGLIEAYCMGYLVVSLQPGASPQQLIRDEVFNLLEIPVLTSEFDLSQYFRQTSHRYSKSYRHKCLTNLFYNFGNSLDRLYLVLNQL